MASPHSECLPIIILVHNPPATTERTALKGSMQWRRLINREQAVDLFIPLPLLAHIKHYVLCITTSNSVFTF